MLDLLLSAAKASAVFIQSGAKASSNCATGSTASGVMRWRLSRKKSKNPKENRNECANNHCARAQEHSCQGASRARLRCVHGWPHTLVAARSWHRQEADTEGADGAAPWRPLARNCGG